VGATGISTARADFVPWTYNFGRDPIVVTATNSALGKGTGGLTLTDEQTHHADGSSDIVATNIRAFSSAPRATPDRVTNGAYTLSLFLQDDLSKQSTTLTFKGAFNGTISATSANIANTFDPSKLSQSVTLGGHLYTVTLGNYSPPGPPDASNAGSISAHVGVDEFTPPPTTGGGPGPTGNAPEPSTLVLSCLGLTSLGLAGWRKWRQKRLGESESV
jgi:hypothetical protein